MNTRYQTTQGRGLYRSREDAVFAGVCGGIAENLDLPAWGVRLIWVLLTIMFFFPLMIVVYFVLALVLPRRAPLAPPIPGDSAEAFWMACGHSHGEALRRLQNRFEAIDQRLQRLESIVTSPRFGLEDEYRKL